MSLRRLPPVDALAAQVDAPRALAVAAARAVLGQRRAELLAGASDEADLGERARAWVDDATRPSLRRVLNATGVIVHTNLGRAPLAEAAREAVARVAEGYSALELDVSTGGRGSRHAHVEPLLRELTGAEAGFAVNNGAGAALLAVAALAGGRADSEIVVSRGQLVEIGGGFRVPDVIAQAGARLVEVGTTNRTRLSDYERALTPDTAAVLRVHQSNFRQLGFVEDVPIEPLCELGVPVIDDVGSGALAATHDEPPVRRSVAAGAALVCFSGDKLLGGPQAGLLVGREAAVETACRHPLARALRIDKLSLAALEATLRVHRDTPDDLPVRTMLDTPRDVLQNRAERLAAAAEGEVIEGVARVGGGALPLFELPGPIAAVAAAFAAPLRAGDPPVLGRLDHDRLLLDPRTLTDAEIELVAAALRDVRPLKCL
jgi:L-seryl-tRNA(Ser) seleniumtransferase